MDWLIGQVASSELQVDNKAENEGSDHKNSLVKHELIKIITLKIKNIWIPIRINVKILRIDTADYSIISIFLLYFDLYDFFSFVGMLLLFLPFHHHHGCLDRGILDFLLLQFFLFL